MQDARAQAAAFFDAFVTAFASFDGAVVAQRYDTPYLALDASGGRRVFTDAAEVAAFFGAVLAGYRARGCATCRWRDLEAQDIGPAHLLASVTWDLLDAAGAVVTSWRESYTLTRTAAGLRVAASIDH